MANVDQSLVEQAFRQLNCTSVKELKPGGQKVVHLVEREGQQSVMKVIEIVASYTEALQRAEREVALLAELSSAHVVQVTHDLVKIGDPVQGAAWLEEYLDGDDLTAFLSEPWEWGRAAEMGYQVALGLGVAHERGVVHRDLSPNNVRLTSSGQYKVMDFGFARFTLRSGLTIAGQPGTPGFMSPEHVNAYSGTPTPASDVFVLGILMYCALTGVQPFPYGGDEAEYFHRLQAVDFPDIKLLRDDLEDDQIAFLRRCMHPQPARRFRNGGQVARALEVLK
jgi:eukaryotic-like serine/threonine-protein kinase